MLFSKKISTLLVYLSLRVLHFGSWCHCFLKSVDNWSGWYGHLWYCLVHISGFLSAPILAARIYWALGCQGSLFLLTFLNRLPRSKVIYSMYCKHWKSQWIVADLAYFDQQILQIFFFMLDNFFVRTLH